MAEISYVILSDMHFGAANSVLTSLVPLCDEATVTSERYRSDPASPTPLLEAMLAGLRQLTAGQERPPRSSLPGTCSTSPCRLSRWRPLPSRGSWTWR